MTSIPHTQHRPICARATPVGVAHPTPFRRRSNLRKADWDGYSTELDTLIEDDEHIPKNYGGFVDKVRVASRRYIPRGCRTNNIYPVYQKNQRACMKSTRNNMQATLVTMVP